MKDVKNFENKKKAVFVFHTTPVFPMGGIFGIQDYSFGKSEKYVDKINKRIEELGLEWEVILDDSRGDIAEIEKKEPEILICASGLQTRFFYGDFKKENIIYLSSLELYSLDNDRVIKFMQSRN